MTRTLQQFMLLRRSFSACQITRPACTAPWHGLLGFEPCRSTQTERLDLERSSCVPHAHASMLTYRRQV